MRINQKTALPGEADRRRFLSFPRAQECVCASQSSFPDLSRNPAQLSSRAHKLGQALENIFVQFEFLTGPVTTENSSGCFQTKNSFIYPHKIKKIFISEWKFALWKNCAPCVHVGKRRTTFFSCPMHSNGRQSRAVTPRRFEGR